MNKDELLEQRVAELKPLAMCLQSAIELYGREKAKELARITLNKYAHDRFVANYENVPMEERWKIFKGDIVKYSDGYGYTLDEQSDNMIKIKYRWCSFLEAFKIFGLEDFVSLYCDTDYTTCQAIHLGITMTRTKILADGDDYCDHCWKYKPE